MKIAFLGLGNMGMPMARHLLKAEHDVTVWNRTAAKAERLKSEGALMASSAGEAVIGAEVAITMLADDHAVVREGYKRLLERTRDIEAGHERHPDIEEGHVGTQLVGQCECLLAVLRFRNRAELRPRFEETRLQLRAEQRFVLGDEGRRHR